MDSTPGVLAMGGWATQTITDDVRAGIRRARLRGHGSGSAAGGTRRNDRTGSGGVWLVDFLEGGNESAEVGASGYDAAGVSPHSGLRLSVTERHTNISSLGRERPVAPPCVLPSASESSPRGFLPQLSPKIN
jgi:hypothetical protein